MRSYPQVLNEKQHKILARLGFLLDFSCYLGGGTALALQLGHRTSLDFDFYTSQKFDNLRLLQQFRDAFDAVEVGENLPADTLQLNVSEINISVFYYPYTLIDKLVEFPPVKMAPLADIAAMKVAAVVQRAKQRDFIDTFYLMNSIGTDKLIRSAFEKYPWYKENSQIVYTALTYFSEADQDEEISRIKVFDTNLTWEKVKEKILENVKDYLA